VCLCLCAIVSYMLLRRCCIAPCSRNARPYVFVWWVYERMWPVYGGGVMLYEHFHRPGQSRLWVSFAWRCKSWPIALREGEERRGGEGRKGEERGGKERRGKERNEGFRYRGGRECRMDEGRACE